MPIYSHVIDDKRRTSHTAALFGLHFPLKLEPTVFALAGTLSNDYSGGLWQFNALCNGGFYMAPIHPPMFRVRCVNGFKGELSADALGITACLYAYSQLSFDEGAFAEICGEHFHRLRDFTLDHAEARLILAAGD